MCCNVCTMRFVYNILCVFINNQRGSSAYRGSGDQSAGSAGDLRGHGLCDDQHGQHRSRESQRYRTSGVYRDNDIVVIYSMYIIFMCHIVVCGEVKNILITELLKSFDLSLYIRSRRK